MGYGKLPIGINSNGPNECGYRFGELSFRKGRQRMLYLAIGIIIIFCLLIFTDWPKCSKTLTKLERLEEEIKAQEKARDSRVRGE